MTRRLANATRSARGALLALTWLCSSPICPAAAQPYGTFNRPQDDWKVAQTRHFRFYYTAETPDTTAYLMQLADATFERLNQFYQVKFHAPITVTIVSNTAYSNGFADSVRNRITILASPPNFHSRRRGPWLKNVFTHELSHILSLNRATHVYRRMPLLLGTGVARTSGTQTLLRLPITGRNYPHWFVEGVAQFDTQRLDRDTYDENRRAFQRAAFEDRRLLPLGKLAFSGGEAWYNTGFDFLNYLEKRFGQGSVHRLFAAYGDSYYLVFDNVFSDVLNVSLDQLESDYRASVQARFDAHLKASAYGHFDGDPVAIEGVDTRYRELSPGARVDLGHGYRGTPLRVIGGRLFYRAAGSIKHGELSADGNLTDIESLGEGSAVAPQAPGSYFVLRQLETDPDLLPYFYRPGFESVSLVRVDDEGEERVLLHESRFHDFDVCRSRSELAAVYNDGDGGLRLSLQTLTDFDKPSVAVQPSSQRFPLPKLPFDEVRSPRYGPKCERLYFSRRVGEDHDIFALHLTTGKLETVSAEPAFELYPAPAEDGLYFTSARRGAPEVYFLPYGGRSPEPVTLAITAHHYPVDTPVGLLFTRQTSTGFQMHIADASARPKAFAPRDPVEKPTPTPVTISALAAEAEDYAGFDPKHISAPTLVPIVDVIYDESFANGSPVRAQAGLELFMQDVLRTHQLLLRGFVGNQSSILFDYENSMSPITLRLRGGVTDVRSLYLYDSGEDQYDHVTDYQWAFVYGSAWLPLNLFYRVGLTAETTRDIGSTLGARDRPYDWASPRFGRDLFGGFIEYSGLDRSDPLFRERDINRRGYRRFSLRAYYGLERVHPALSGSDATLQVGTTAHLRAQAQLTEYIALPELANGYYDHSLQLDLQLGYISENVRFLPFMGGGRVFSLSSPTINTSVGFGGYRFFSVRGETLLNLALSYRAPLVRRLGWDMGPLFLEDIYWQAFTSWGNIWGYDRDGKRQVPFVDAAPNGQILLGDVGLDIRLGHYIRQTEANVGTTLRAVYRVVPFSACPDESDEPDPSCLEVDGERGFIFYFLLGGGF